MTTLVRPPPLPPDPALTPPAHPELRPQINSLLAIELRSLLPKQATQTPSNLSHLPPPRPLPTAPFLSSELARVASKKPLAPGVGLDSTRYSLPPPSSAKLDDVIAWQASHEAGLAQLEHARLRAMNGQLLGSLGGNAWRIQNFAMENTVERVEKEGEEVRKVVEEVNRERKRVQVEEGGPVLGRLEKRWTELVSGNMQLEIGCMAL